MTTTLRYLVMTTLVLGLFAAGAFAASSRAELKERFIARYPEVAQLKSDGKIGETAQGYLDAVKSQYSSEPKVSQILGAENADRTDLFADIAAETKANAADVAARAGARNFQNAKPGEWLKYADGSWRQK